MLVLLLHGRILDTVVLLIQAYKQTTLVKTIFIIENVFPTKDLYERGFLVYLVVFYLFIFENILKKIIP